jgi:hypothetical protein
LLAESEKDLIDEFDRLLQREWQHEGLSPNDVKLFCQDRSLPYYCLGSGLLDSWQPETPKGRSVAFATWDGHAYFYKSARVVSEWSATAPQGKGRWQLASEVVSQLPPVSEWRPWADKRKAMPRNPGYFFCHDLRAARAQILRWGKNPKVTLRSLAEYSSLRYSMVSALDGSAGTVVIRELPREHKEIAAWARKLGVEWCGERLPGLAFKAFQQLLKVSRRTPGADLQEKILKKQGGKCAVCREVLKEPEFDHEAPLKQLQGQGQTFRALCCDCHAEATAHEGGGRALESRFSRSAWEDFVMSPRPPTLAWRPHELSEKIGQDKGNNHSSNPRDGYSPSGSDKGYHHSSKSRSDGTPEKGGQLNCSPALEGRGSQFHSPALAPWPGRPRARPAR